MTVSRDIFGNMIGNYVLNIFAHPNYYVHKFSNRHVCTIRVIPISVSRGVWREREGEGGGLAAELVSRGREV